MENPIVTSGTRSLITLILCYILMVIEPTIEREMIKKTYEIKKNWDKYLQGKYVSDKYREEIQSQQQYVRIIIWHILDTLGCKGDRMTK